MAGKMEFEEFEEKYQTLTTKEMEQAAIELVKSAMEDQEVINSTVFTKMVDIHLIMNNPNTEFYEIIPLQKQVIVEHYSYEEFLIRRKY